MTEDASAARDRLTAHLAELARLQTDQGIWLNVETLFARGRKPG